jgi:hypothetical protein
MSNGTDPAQLSTEERLDEITSLLVGALMRLRARKSSPLSRDRGESLLDFSPNQRGHAPVQDLLEDAP